MSSSSKDNHVDGPISSETTSPKSIAEFTVGKDLIPKLSYNGKKPTEPIESGQHTYYTRTSEKLWLTENTTEAD